jgi:hypothetical protein
MPKMGTRNALFDCQIRLSTRERDRVSSEAVERSGNAGRVLRRGQWPFSAVSSVLTLFLASPNSITVLSR